MCQESWVLLAVLQTDLHQLGDKEVDAIMNRLQQVGDKPRPKTLFEPGEMVRVSDGPFADFNGVVEEVDY